MAAIAATPAMARETVFITSTLMGQLGRSLKKHCAKKKGGIAAAPIP
jgi:hypothetical protein